MRTPSWRGLSLGFLLVCGLLAPWPTASADPFHLQVSNELRTNSEPLDADNWIAQSFLPASGFWISRVSLYVSDLGVSGLLTVSIRPSAGAFPGGSNVTQGTADGPPVEGWVDVNLNFVQLSAGQSYWIVAHSADPGGDGYEWWHSGNEATYADGMGVRSPDGLAWAPRGRDFSFRVYGFVQPSLSFSVTASRPTLLAGQSTVFRVNFTNAGPGSSAAVWVNVSLPAELEYVTDDAATIAGVRSGAYSFAFMDIPPAARSFNITVRAKGGVANGTSVVVGFAFEAADHNGASLSSSSTNVPVGFVATGNPVNAWLWWLVLLAAGAAVAVAAAVAIRRRRRTDVSVEDVFVADHNGLLLAHRSNTVVPYQDEDLVAGMVTVVQQFVKDAFSRGTDEVMRALEFGERRILIERGRNHSLVVVYRGTDDGKLRERMRTVSAQIEERFGQVVATWNGDSETVRGITFLLPLVWAPRPL